MENFKRNMQLYSGSYRIIMVKSHIYLKNLDVSG